jgi:hypothetical protein
MKSRKSSTSNLSDSVNRHLDAYAAAAVAAQKTDRCGLHIGPCHHSPPRWPYLVGALGMLALAEPSEAKIVYTPASQRIQDGTFRFDLNHDGKADIVLWQDCGGYFNHCDFEAWPVQGNGVEQGTGGEGWAAALKAGAEIGPSAQFNQASRVVMAVRGPGTHPPPDGYWFYSQTRYLGVAFQIKGKTHYGWMRIKQSSEHGGTLTGYAYETIPGKAIKAGQTKGPDELTGSSEAEGPDDPGPGASLSALVPQAPQPASLGMLALGARGVSLWRRKGEVE